MIEIGFVDSFLLSLLTKYLKIMLSLLQYVGYRQAQEIKSSNRPNHREVVARRQRRILYKKKTNDQSVVIDDHANATRCKRCHLRPRFPSPKLLTSPRNVMKFQSTHTNVCNRQSTTQAHQARPDRADQRTSKCAQLRPRTPGHPVRRP